MATVGQLNVNLSARVGKFMSDLRAAGDRMERFGNRSKRVGREVKSAFRSVNKAAAEMQSAIQTGLKIAFAGMGIAVGAAVKQFASFERQAVRVAAITGELETAGAGGVEAISDEMLRLSTTTEFTATQVGEAFGFMAQSGLNFNQVVAAAPGVLQLASAAAMDVARAADIATNVMKGFGLEIAELGRVNDVLLKTSTSSNTSVSQLGEAIKFVGPVARSAGVEIEEVSAALGILGDAGLQGELGGTALRGSLAKLLAPSKEAKRVLENLGISISAADLRTKDGLAKTLTKLQPLVGRTGDIFKVFGQRAGPGMAVLLEAGVDKLKELTGELREAGGTAKMIAEAQLDTLDGRIKIFKSNVEATAISLGKQLEPAATALFAALQRVSEGFRILTEDILTFRVLENADSPAVEQMDQVITKVNEVRTRLNKAKSNLATLWQFRNEIDEMLRFGASIDEVNAKVRDMAGAHGFGGIAKASVPVAALQKAIDATTGSIKKGSKELKTLLGISTKIVATDPITTDPVKPSTAGGDPFAGLGQGAEEAGESIKNKLVEPINDVTKALSAMVAGPGMLGLAIVGEGLTAPAFADLIDDTFTDDMEAAMVIAAQWAPLMDKVAESTGGLGQETDAVSEELRELLDASEDLAAGFNKLSSGEMLSRTFRGEGLAGGMFSKDTGAAIGRALDAGITSGADGIVNSIGSSIGSVIGKAAGPIGSAIGGAVGGPVASGLISALTSMIEKVGEGLSKAAGQIFKDFFSDQRLGKVGAFTSSIGAVIVPMLLLGAVLGSVTGGLGFLVAGLALAATAIFGLVGVTIVAAQQTKNFERVQSGFTKAMDNFFGHFESMAFEFLALVPIAMALGDVFGEILSSFGGGVPRIIFEGMKMLALGVLGAVIAVESLRLSLFNVGATLETALISVGMTMNTVMSGLLQTVGDAIMATNQFMTENPFQDAIDSLDEGAGEMQARLAELGDEFSSTLLTGATNALEDLAGMDFMEALRRGAEATRDAGEMAKDSFGEMSEQLTNVPQGFKVALERFRAITPGLGNAPVPEGAEDAGAGAGPVMIETLILQVADFEDFVEKAGKVADERRQEQGGGLTAEQLIGGTRF